jgi:hypothetical protein
MANSITVSSNLRHDGDGVVLYTIRAQSEDFAAATEVWGYVDRASELGRVLDGFPRSSSDERLIQFGSSGIGSCSLRFFCVDGVGHSAVWATLVAPHAARSTDLYERAELFVRVEPVAIDEFSKQLMRFESGKDNVAVLRGVPQYESFSEYAT